MADQILHEQNIWTKSFLIEIKYTDRSPETFTFSLPPEGIEITMPQRVSETKTFGGIFIDDYGTEAAKIHFSGTTGNSTVKKIYRGEKSLIWLNNKEEIFYLRDTIIRYKDKIKNGGERKAATITLYNLNSHDWGAIYSNGRSSFIDAWEVILKDFKITQNKDRPMVYNYSIDFTGIRLLGSSKITERTENGLQADTPKKINLLKKILNAIETWYGMSEAAKNAVWDARAAVNRFTGEVERYLSLVTGSFDNIMQIYTDEAGIIVDVYDSFKRITMAPADSALRVVKSLKNLRETVEAAIKDMGTLPEQWSERYGAVEDAVQSDMGVYKRCFEDDMQDAENTANDFYARSSSSSNPIVIIILMVLNIALHNRFGRGTSVSGGSDGGSGGDSGSGSGDGTDSSTASGEDGGTSESSGITPNIVISYGFLRHIANSLTTLEKLARAYLGDPDKAYVIALINGITGDDEINPGDQIKIPILTPNNVNALNKIFGPVSIRDTLGIDIAIENGIFQAGPNGDFMVKADYKNMDQAINSRLCESLGNRLRLNTYGIRNVAGAPDAIAAAYISTSIKDTVLQDPRVERIEDLYFQGSGDHLLVQFSYYTYDGILHQYIGGL
jgi:hypothetical protein